MVTDILGLSGMTVYRMRHNGGSIDGAVSELCKKWKDEVSGRRSAVFTTIADPAIRKRMNGKYMADVFGGFGYLTKAIKHWGLRGCVLDTKFGLRYDVTQPLFSPEFDKTFPLETVSQG